jgi:hypothetical protein
MQSEMLSLFARERSVSFGLYGERNRGSASSVSSRVRRFLNRECLHLRTVKMSALTAYNECRIFEAKHSVAKTSSDQMR